MIGITVETLQNTWVSSNLFLVKKFPHKFVTVTEMIYAPPASKSRRIISFHLSGNISKQTATPPRF